MGKCCNNVGPTGDMSSSLLLNVVASRTKPNKCCSKSNCSSCGVNPGNVGLNTINRNKQILQLLKCCK
jgi:hypothetical protein